MTSNHAKPSFLDWLLTLPQYIIPQLMLSRLVFILMRLPLGIITHWGIKGFIYYYAVDMKIAHWQKISDYKTFNQFFTRALKAGARPLANATIISPVDGQMSQIGKIQQGSLLQAKGRWFQLTDLLAQPADKCQAFQEGLFCTLYLSPKDYHRVHIPIAGRLTQMSYIPGRLFSVNQRTSRVVPRLFARNERVICYFETIVGTMAVIFVGALLVGSIETVWAGTITPNHHSQIQHWHYAPPTAPSFNQGEEIGRFNMGSTVIILFEPQQINWLPHLVELTDCQVGQALAQHLL